MAIQIKGHIMSFKNKNLSVVAYCSGWTLWQYRTEDMFEEIDGNYFPVEIKKLMAVGDIIIINSKNETGIRAIKSLSPLMEIGTLN